MNDIEEVRSNEMAEFALARCDGFASEALKKGRWTGQDAISIMIVSAYWQGVMDGRAIDAGDGEETHDE